MKVIDCKQGTPEWTQARLGIPTASQFGRIISPKTGKALAGSHSYMCELIAERLTGEPADAAVSQFMERGTELENEAVAAYEFENDCEVERVGFITTDDGRAGCSPDGLVGTRGGLEIKCPAAKTHVSYMLATPDTYRAQVQGALWVTERDYWDFLSFNPEMPRVLIRQERDDAFISKLACAVAEFCDRMDEALRRIKEEYTP